MFKLQELAELVGGQVKGNGDLQVAGFCSLDNPNPTSISYLEKNKDAAKLSDIMLGALVTTDQLAQYFPDVIVVANPKLAFVSIMERFLSRSKPEPTAGYVHERAVVDPAAEIAETAIVEANAVIGADGFGFVPTKDGHRKFPQVGSVLIEEHVEIGANCCIDRASLDQTVIHSGTKLDNMVQIAHGVRLGSNTVIAAQTGISGSTRIGNWCVIGGQAGFQGHITIGDQSIIAAQSGVFSDLPFKSKVSGYPAKPHAQSLKVLALTFKLPELVEKIKSLEIELDLISGELKGLAKRERRRRQTGEQPPLITPEA